MMAENYTKELNQKNVREKLNYEKIKLWLPPYTTESDEKGDIPKDLVDRFSKDLKLPEDEITEIFESLRVHAIQKLQERNKFQESGLATIKVKISGQKSKEETKHSLTSVEISLDSKGQDFRKMISDRIGIPQDQLKIICQGKVVGNDTTLKEQNVKNSSQVLVLCLSVSESEAAKQQLEITKFMSTKKAAELLSTQAGKDDDDFEIQIADQSGRPLQLPAEEKKALTLAMTLHEKGRVALKKKEIAQALLLLLEADKEFSKCRADILNAVDNYAVLCLDIVWCYLCLKNVEDLPDAEKRLNMSEDCFIRSYGSNFERLNAVKGGSGTELALFMRLHLLQGIVAFHQHRLQDARRLLSKAEFELQHLVVDSEKLTEVMTMGFNEREARLGLRASAGHIEQAVQHIMQRKEEKKGISKKIKEERRKKRIQKSLGLTANKDKVNVDSYEMLTNMGFGGGAAAEALRQANNDVGQALEVLEKHPEFLSLPDPEHKDITITDEMLAQVYSLGFDPEMAREALKLHAGSIQKAIDELIRSGGILARSSSEGSSDGSSADSSPEAGPSNINKTEEKKRKKEEKEALQDFMSDLPEDEEDYLDLTLTEEEQFLKEYKSLVDSLGDT
ncbi:NEDD8 ultimate buster 1-like [Mytilus galloprovincialis]|uniref:NEDD8 ultimate buster 1-like n=1 Tax=Mytilus galloprovincialis TaxID=29158 RepID=UPI003F7CD34E